MWQTGMETSTAQTVKPPGSLRWAENTIPVSYADTS